ncbi:hypothetical protein [Streptomyces sp. NPDC020965]|uniref:hypothetical protein n=1 Tax=Streptomyces sp. NPDC020965 TaxID=3365105 RepID=UPI0037ADD1FB
MSSNTTPIPVPPAGRGPLRRMRRRVLSGLATLALAAGAVLAVPQAAHAVSNISVSSTTVAAGDTFTITFNGLADFDIASAGENFYAGSSTLGPLPDFTTIESCTGNTAPCTSAFGIAQRVPLGDLTEGAAFDGTLTLRVNPATPAGTFVLGHQLYGDTASDPTVYETPITVTSAPPPAADLAVDVTAQPHLGILTPYLTYTLTAHNTGPGAVTSATVTATLPPGASATGLPTGCTTATGTVTCTYGAIANGTSAAKSFRLPLHLLSLGHVTITGTRTASTPADPNPANDTDSATCTVISILLATCP